MIVNGKKPETLEELRTAKRLLDEEAAVGLSLEQLRLKLAQAEEEAEEAQGAIDAAEEQLEEANAECERLEKLIEEREKAEPEETPRTVLALYVALGWNVDIPANKLAEIERAAADLARGRTP